MCIVLKTNQCQGSVSGKMCHCLSACVWHVLYVLYVSAWLCQHSQTQSVFCSRSFGIVTIMLSVIHLHCRIKFPEASVYFFNPPTSAPQLFCVANFVYIESLRSIISLPESQQFKSKDHLCCATQMDNCNKLD